MPERAESQRGDEPACRLSHAAPKAWPPWLTLSDEDLTDTTRALVLYTSLCGCGVLVHDADWMDDEHCLRFLSLVEEALANGHSPAGLLRWRLVHQPWDRGTPVHEAAALTRLQDYHIALFEADQPRQGDRAP